MIHNCNTNPELLEDSHPAGSAPQAWVDISKGPYSLKAKSPFRTFLSCSHPSVVKRITRGKTKCQEAEVRLFGPWVS